MNPKFCIAVTTFKKNAALKVFLETFRKYCNWDWISNIIICDDNYPEGKEVFSELKDLYGGKLQYTGGTRKGVAVNKNRGIKFFLEKTEDEFFLTFDDDIQFIGSGIEEALLKAGYGHLTGYLGGEFGIADEGKVIGSSPFFSQFPPQGENESLYFCTGCQGIMMFFKRNILEKAKYLTVLKGFYGYEHSVFSSKISRLFGMYPKWFAVLKNCPKYFITQEIPNNYDDHLEGIRVNGEQYPIIMNEIYQGIYLVNNKSGVENEQYETV